MLLDYLDIVVHVQHAEERGRTTRSERLWKDCPVIALPEDVTNGRTGASRYREPRVRRTGAGRDRATPRAGCGERRGQGERVGPGRDGA